MTDSTEPLDDPLPPSRLILPLQRGDAPVVDGLEQYLAGLIAKFYPQADEQLAFTPPADNNAEWVPATEHTRSLEKVEAQLYHAIDEQSTKNPTAVAALQAAPPEAQRAAILAADDRMQAVIERLREQGVAITAEVFEMAEVE